MRDEVTVLVVDDVDTNLFMLSTMLKREGFAVLTASAGPEGRAVARERRPDLILLDVLMPGESGFETCSLLRADPATAGIPIVFLSALEDTESKIRGLAAGAVDYVSKPFMKEEVVARIRVHIRLGRTLRLLAREQAELLREASAAYRARESGGPETPPGVKLAFRGNAPLEGGAADAFEIADGISGYLLAESEDGDSASDIAALVRMNAGPLYGPAETMDVVSAVLRSRGGTDGRGGAAYCVLNRNSSRLSVVLAGHPPVLASTSAGGAEAAGYGGGALGSAAAPSVRCFERPIGSGSRVLMYSSACLGALAPAEGVDTLRRVFASTLGVPLDEQAAALASSLLPPAAASFAGPPFFLLFEA